MKRVIKRHIMHFEAFEDIYLRERAADFRDLGRRILAHLQTEKRQPLEYPKKTILISEEVTATNIMEVPRERLAGIISGYGFRQFPRRDFSALVRCAHGDGIDWCVV